MDLIAALLTGVIVVILVYYLNKQTNKTTIYRDRDSYVIRGYLIDILREGEENFLYKLTYRDGIEIKVKDLSSFPLGWSKTTISENNFVREITK